MVLKRLLVTTLGALGLGALAAGPASAQQVPAPNLFDGQVACSSNVPDGAADGPLATALAEAVMDGEMIGSEDADNDPTTEPTYTMGLAGLNYIIPPGNNNCGAGGPVDDDDASTVDVAPSVAGPIAMDVAAGYTETLDAYLASRTEDAAVKAANKALSALLTDETDDDIQTATITAARETLAAAQTKQAAAHAKLYSVGAGPINMRGIAEWRAKFAVEDAVTAWNTAVGTLETESVALNAGTVQYDDYVPLRENTQIDGLVDDAGVVNLANVRTYANAAGTNTAVQDAMTGEITGTGNFDAAGNLIIPMEDIDDETEGDQLGPTKVPDTTYMTISDRLESVNTTVKALKKLQTDNKNALLQPAIDEAVRRAEVEQAHYQMQFNEAVADNTDLDGDAENGVVSIKSLYGKYTAAKTARDNKGVELTTAFQARELATTAVAAAFTNPQNFYQQLVDRREFTKAAAEAEVTRLAGLTGDDAATDAETTAAATAVTTAETALTAATKAQAAFQDLVAEGSPVAELVNELLKGDAVGDDGGKLVDAIVGAYDGQAAAAERLDELLKETTTSTPELDADGNAVTDADGIPQRTEVVTESGRIVDIETSIAGLTGEGGDVAENTAAIAANTTEIGDNFDNITALDGRVTTNEEGIVALGGRVDDNETDIGANTTAIGANTTAIGANTTAIGANTTAIGANTTAIGTNATNITANATNIMTNVTDIATNVTAIADEKMAREMADTMLADDIMTNAGNIMANEMSIGVNASGISTNVDGIAANMNAIGANAASIADNRNMIGELSDDLSVVRAGVAASMALAGMPAINGRGISIGVGSFDGESAFAVGFQIQGEMASFKVGVTSGGGATGASAGVGFQF